MDRRLILAVAGSGKTTYLINHLNLERNCLIVTYTENNLIHIRKCVIRKFGYVPENITLLSYFQFLLRVCYRPFYKEKVRARGVSWNMLDPKTQKLNRNQLTFYITKNKYLHYNRIAKLCQFKAEYIRERIEKYYDCFMFDEVQDLGGHDFDLIRMIVPQNKDCLFVGDFFQHTFETSLDGNLHKGLYKDLNKYIKEWEITGIAVDTQTLSNSHRCSPTICQYVTENIGINIASYRVDTTNIYYIDNQADADALFSDRTKAKLFLQESNKYNCYGINWGASKGLDDFQDICIVLNASTLKVYLKGSLCDLVPSTRNKLYVACTRSKGNIYFIPHTFTDKYKQR